MSVIEISKLPRTLPPPGPYIWTPRGPHRVYGLYEDTQQAYFSAISQGGSADMPTFTEMRPATQIAVPSRLYFEPPSPAHPLSGLRFGVTDVFDIKGLKTSAGSKVYHRFYPKRDETAPIIAHLVKLGSLSLLARLRTPNSRTERILKSGLTTHVHGIPEVCYHKTSLIWVASVLIGQVTGIRTRIPAAAEVRQLLQAMTGWALLSDPMVSFFPTSTFETPVRTRFKSTILTPA